MEQGDQEPEAQGKWGCRGRADSLKNRTPTKWLQTGKFPTESLPVAAFSLQVIDFLFRQLCFLTANYRSEGGTAFLCTLSTWCIMQHGSPCCYPRSLLCLACLLLCNQGREPDDQFLLAFCFCLDTLSEISAFLTARRGNCALNQEFNVHVINYNSQHLGYLVSIHV